MGPKTTENSNQGQIILISAKSCGSRRMLTEMWLLVTLIRRPGVVKSRSSLIDEAYAANIHVDERTIDSHMKRIRSKFREIDPDFDGIESVYGVGYRFRVRQANTAGMLRSAKKGLYPMRSLQGASRLPVLHGLRADAGCFAS